MNAISTRRAARIMGSPMPSRATRCSLASTSACVRARSWPWSDPSGCGKTTLLHLAAGLLTVQQGRVDSGFASTAFMFQQPRLLPWKTALD